MSDLVKVVLKKHAALVKTLGEKLKTYQESAGLSRKFTRMLRHCGSFLGRDFKILLQILPIVRLKDFFGEAVLADITPLFVKLGELSSLLFVREVKEDFDCYFSAVKKAVTEFISTLHSYDKDCSYPSHNPYCSKLKIHLLTHIHEDIVRFRAVLLFETEKEEQFNKHIREHIMFTNKLNPSRDAGLKFAKQSIIRHIVEGGSWLNKDGLRERGSDELLAYIEENNREMFVIVIFLGFLLFYFFSLTLFMPFTSKNKYRFGTGTRPQANLDFLNV